MAKMQDLRNLMAIKKGRKKGINRIGNF